VLDGNVNAILDEQTMLKDDWRARKGRERSANSDMSDPPTRFEKRSEIRSMETHNT
jgi:hypothetical protein